MDSANQKLTLHRNIFFGLTDILSEIKSFLNKSSTSKADNLRSRVANSEHIDNLCKVFMLASSHLEYPELIGHVVPDLLPDHQTPPFIANLETIIIIIIIMAVYLV